MKGNQVILVGYVGQNLKTGQSGDDRKRVAIRVATHDHSRAKQSGKHNETVWHDVIAWGGTALFAERNFVKGSRILVEGSIVYRTYVDHSGHMRYITQIKAHSLMNLDR